MLTIRFYLFELQIKTFPTIDLRNIFINIKILNDKPYTKFSGLHS